MGLGGPGRSKVGPASHAGLLDPRGEAASPARHQRGERGLIETLRGARMLAPSCAHWHAAHSTAWSTPLLFVCHLQETSPQLLPGASEQDLTRKPAQSQLALTFPPAERPLQELCISPTPAQPHFHRAFPALYTPGRNFPERTKEPAESVMPH